MGKVIFIGAGPGAADLITLRGARLLATADVVLYDALTDPALRQHAPNARWLHVGKRGFCDSTGQATINALLVKHALESQTVVRLKGGDPSIFGRLEVDLRALAEHGIETEVVPGVTSAVAAAASSQRPLTRRGTGRSVSFATAMTRTGDLNATRTADTEVFYMAGKQLAELSRQLMAAGWRADTPVSVVSRAGWPDALHSEHPVGELARGGVLHAGRPTIVTVGAGAAALTTLTSDNGAASGETLEPLKCTVSPHGGDPRTHSNSPQEP
jgi:uroporphyrin-III C-methyltransferase